MGQSIDRRLHVREVIDAGLEIEWTSSDGVRHSMVGSAMDSSKAGLAGVFPDYAPIGQNLTVKLIDAGLRGQGVVRHSTPVDAEFLIGIALTGDLKDT
jgi:hypothetical protein